MTKNIKFCDVCEKQMENKEEKTNFKVTEKIQGVIMFYLNGGNASDICNLCKQRIFKSMMKEPK